VGFLLLFVLTSSKNVTYLVAVITDFHPISQERCNVL